MDLADRTITAVAGDLRSRELSSREVTEACLARIDRDGARLNTFLAVEADAALEAADAADRALASGDDRPLLGIPYALKDIFVTRALDADGAPLPGGLPTTAGSKILAGYRSPYASDAQQRLDAAGAILLGKTNCDEFAMGSSNENSRLRARAQSLGPGDGPRRAAAAGARRRLRPARRSGRSGPTPAAAAPAGVALSASSASSPRTDASAATA